MFTRKRASNLRIIYPGRRDVKPTPSGLARGLAIMVSSVRWPGGFTWLDRP